MKPMLRVGHDCDEGVNWKRNYLMFDVSNYVCLIKFQNDLNEKIKIRLYRCILAQRIKQFESTKYCSQFLLYLPDCSSRAKRRSAISPSGASRRRASSHDGVAL